MSTPFNAPALTAGNVGSAALRGAGWLAADTVGSRIIDMAFAVVLARLLSPEHFGLLAMAASSTAFFRLFANLGLAAAIVQRAEVDEETLSTAFWANLASGVVLFLLIAGLGEVFGLAFREPRVATIILVISLRFIIAAGSATQVAMISRRLDFRSLTLREISATTIGGLIGVACAYRGLGVWSLVAQELGRATVATVLLYRATGWRPTRRFSWPKFRSLWSFGGPILMSRLFAYLIRNADNVLVGRYLGAGMLGFYSFGFTIFSAPLNDFSAIIHRVMFSVLSRLQEDTGRFKEAFLRASRYATMLQMPAMVGLALVSAPLVEVVFGSKWLPAAPVVSLLSLAAVVGMMTSLAPSSIQASGRADLHLRGTLVAVAAYVPAFAVGLRWGIVGVAAGYLVATVALAPVGFRYMRQATGIRGRELLAVIWPSVTACALMAAGVGIVRGLLGGLAPVLMLLVLVPTGIVLYGALLWGLEREALRGLFDLVRRSLLVPARRLAREAD